MSSLAPTLPPAAGRRLTRGMVEQRGSRWWNRYRAEFVDPYSGTTTRRQTRMLLGEFRSASAAAEALDRYIVLQSIETLSPGPTITFRQYGGRFDRLRICLMRPESRRNYRSVIKNHLDPSLGRVPLSSIDATRVQELVAALHAKGLARATVATVRNRLLEILRHARAAGFATHVVTRSSAKLPAEQRAEVQRRHINPQELDAILAASKGARRTLWAVLGFAGLRIGEALALTWLHVDRAQGVLHVRQAAVAGLIAPLKTKQSRRDVPLLPELDAILAEFRAQQAAGSDALLFASRTGKALRSDDVRRRWLKPLLKALKIPAAGCHAFRHGLPGRLDALGLTPAAIQRFMGHSSLAMTEVYLHHTSDDLRAQLDRALKRAPKDPAQSSTGINAVSPSLAADAVNSGASSMARNTPGLSAS